MHQFAMYFVTPVILTTCKFTGTIFNSDDIQMRSAFRLALSQFSKESVNYKLNQSISIIEVSDNFKLASSCKYFSPLTLVFVPFLLFEESFVLHEIYECCCNPKVVSHIWYQHCEWSMCCSNGSNRSVCRYIRN